MRLTPGGGLAQIAAYGKQHHPQLEPRQSPQKGRTLHATKALRQGEQILVEGPLHSVQACAQSPAFKKLRRICKQYPDDFDFEPLWYWCALRSLTAKQLKGAHEGGWPVVAEDVQTRLLLLHHEDESLESKPGSSSRILVREMAPAADPDIIDRLTQVFVLNGFDYTDEPKGYCTYFYSSFMSHSCFPNAFWHYDGDNHVVRAREDIACGDEVCITYLPEDWLVRSVLERRWDLNETKRFWCSCERCTGNEDLCRGMMCSSCRRAPVFAVAPVLSRPEGPVPEAGDWLGATCGSCGHKVGKAEAQEFPKYENALHALLKTFEESSPEPERVRELEDLVGNVFSQHWLADQAREKLASFYANAGEHSKTAPLLAQRCDFIVAAYPGLSGALARQLEAQADAQREIEGSPVMRTWRTSEVRRLYAKAEQMLSTMYGSGGRKIARVRRKLQRAEAEALAAKPEPPSAPKRRRG